MNSHERQIEKCNRCTLPCKGTGKKWIDGTRICFFCWEKLVADLVHVQEKLYEMQLLRVYPIIRNHNPPDGAMF